MAGVNYDEPPTLLSFIIPFRLAFRFVTLIDPVLGMVLFYNALPMLGFPRLFIISHPLIMGIAETYLVVTLRRGSPFDSLLRYFTIAIVFEFPCALLKGGDSGLILFPWCGTQRLRLASS